LILQLNPHIPLLTPKGGAQAIFLIDYSEEHDLFFVCISDQTGEIWTFPNHQVRGFRNVSIGRHTDNNTALEQLRKPSDSGLRKRVHKKHHK